ncbi:uncharacterized protein LOC119652913 isoform X3 [Hermetia illucens]|uniref:uncharacterized protein LOC119652913 isoform X3 n=1 Tax=Hermetia illucens TaxID=343691 RepID=UPI0018CC6336|nr:uncharacterized protein LOC119652913 isoform X3 [Hermetia illucens]
MRKITTIVFFCLCAVVASAQFFGPQFDSSGSYSGFGGDFGGPSAFGNIRDSRQNRGPVVFPDPPADAPIESSGVIVGASGYGFVPPRNRAQSLLKYEFDAISRHFGRLNYF